MCQGVGGAWRSCRKGPGPGAKVCNWYVLCPWPSQPLTGPPFPQSLVRRLGPWSPRVLPASFCGCVSPGREVSSQCEMGMGDGMGSGRRRSRHGLLPRLLDCDHLRLLHLALSTSQGVSEAQIQHLCGRVWETALTVHTCCVPGSGPNASRTSPHPTSRQSWEEGTAISAVRPGNNPGACDCTAFKDQGWDSQEACSVPKTGLFP